jgi:hypothetical protein
MLDDENEVTEFGASDDKKQESFSAEIKSAFGGELELL